MTRRSGSKPKPKPATIPVGVWLRCLLYLGTAGQILSLKGQAVLPVVGGLTLTLCLFSLFLRPLGEEEGRALILSGLEGLLVSFLIFTGGVDSSVLLLSVALTALTALERGQQAGVLFALVNCSGWLGPTLMDKQLSNLNFVGVLFRIWVICLTPFVVLGLPAKARSEHEDDNHERLRNVALEKAQALARSQSEARAAREQELYAERRKLEALMQIAHRMAVLRNPDELLSTIVSCAKEQLQVDVAVVLLRRGNQLLVEWKEGLTDAVASKLNSQVDTGLLGRLVLSGESFFYSAVDGPEPMRPYWPLQGLEQIIPGLRPTTAGYQAHSDELRNFLVVPLQNPADPGPLGLLLVGNRLVGDRFSEHDQGYLQILATDAAIAIRNLFFMAERERTHDEMIRALAQAIEAKDPYTRGHVTRVCTYSIKLAQAMGLSAPYIKDLNTAAMLHDVGKISTPDHILMKQGPLTDEEFDIMKQHVVHSVRIIRDIQSVSAEIQKMVMGHHERWDGKGYPQGLKGNDIPLGAQIMAVADSYDAMTSDRPYRKGLPPEEAMRRLGQGAGTQFNADIVAYFMALANFTPQENPPLEQLVLQARQRVGANLLRTPTATPSQASMPGSASSGPPRRGPERLELG